MTDPKFIKLNRLFLLLFKKDNNDPAIIYFDKNYMILLEKTDFNTLIDNKQFFDQPLKKKNFFKHMCIKKMIVEHETYYSYHQKNYKTLGADLSKQRNTSIPQQIIFVII